MLEHLVSIKPDTYYTTQLYEHLTEFFNWNVSSQTRWEAVLRTDYYRSADRRDQHSHRLNHLCADQALTSKAMEWKIVELEKQLRQLLECQNIEQWQVSIVL